MKASSYIWPMWVKPPNVRRIAHITMVEHSVYGVRLTSVGVKLVHLDPEVEEMGQ
jgi:hypothetical protein